MILPDSERDLMRKSQEIVEACRASSGTRGAAYRTYGQWIETGRMGGPLALANMLYAHEERLASHLFSPTALRFSIDFENHYGDMVLRQGEQAARILTREWERRSLDMVFGQGTRMSLDYGAALFKQIADWQVDRDGKRTFKNMRAVLVPPWSFGVYDEGRNVLDQSMEAFVETMWLTQPEVWRRVANLPDAPALYKRILATAQKNEGVSAPQSFMHQVLSTAVLDVSLANATTPQPGGIVQVTNDPNAMTLGPQVNVPLIAMHEIWVWNDMLGDWTTIQYIEPDILITPRGNFKRTNLFCPATHPYTLIQPNGVAGYFWGRSEITDLMMLQEWLTMTTDDIKRIFGTQVDKVLGFVGVDDLTDERYLQFRTQGWQTFAGANAKIQDLTPQMPSDALQILQTILGMMDRVSGFPPILSGAGEPGVRSGVQASALERNASPRLRDRALIVERACAEAADGTLSCMEAKDATVQWFDAEKSEMTSFLLSQLPEDRRVVVDSHSSSPTFRVDHQNQIAFALKAGIIGPEEAIEALDIPDKDLVLERLKARQKAQAQELQALTQRDPEAAAKVLSGKRSHH